RAAVAGHEAAGIQPRGLVAQALHHRQPHQRLHAGQVNAALRAGVLVLQRVVVVGHATGQAGAGGSGRGEFGGAGHGRALWRAWTLAVARAGRRTAARGRGCAEAARILAAGGLRELSRAPVRRRRLNPRGAPGTMRPGVQGLRQPSDAMNRFATRLIGALVLVVLPLGLFAQDIPRPKEFYFEADTDVTRPLELYPAADGEDVVARLLQV